MSKLLVELYDRYNKQNNIYASCICKPDTVVFLCEEDIPSRDKRSLIHFLKDENKSIKRVEFQKVNLMEFDDVILDIVKDFSEVVFEINGGNTLLAVEIYNFALKHNYKLLGYSDDKYLYSWEDKKLSRAKQEIPSLTIEKLVKLHGGKINHISSVPTEDRFEELKKLSLDVFKNTRKWDYFTKLYGRGKCDDKLNCVVPNCISIGNKKVYYSEKVEKVLLKAKMITNPEVLQDKSRKFKYNSHLDKFICTNKGSILEFYLYILAVESGLFDECYRGVTIDWNLNDDRNDVINEIDVVLRKGNTPIFISCKMVKFLTTEMVNELDLYADHFLGKNAVKMIVFDGATSIQFIERCREYNVILIDINDARHNFINIVKKYIKE